MDPNVNNDNNDPVNTNQPESTAQEPAANPAEVQQSHSEQPALSSASSQPQDSKFKQLLKKPVFYAALLALLVVTSGLVFFVSSGDEEVVNNATPESVVAERVVTLGAAIASIEGEVEVSNDGETWTQAESGQSLANLDYVRTLDASRAIILFDDGSVARLDGSTELYLSSLEADALEVTLVDGQVYSRVVESDNLTFTVVTANERFEALGTAYKTSTDGDNDSLEVYQSDVNVASQDVEVSEGNKYDTSTKEVAALDLEALDGDEFAQWNKQKDSESSEFKDKLGVLKDKEEPAPAPSTSASSGITLSASEQADGVKLSWSLQGVSSQQGFKVVRSSSDSTPTYGENDAQYVGDPAARSRVWHSEKGGSHYYRVCIYFEGSCSTYSNSVQANSPAKVVTPVVSGAVALALDGNTISWTLSGGNAPHGFKVVLSTSPNPVYPANSILYTGSQSATLPEKSPGTYYVRVCKYTNGSQSEGCVDYSNQIEYVVPAS